MSFQIILSGIFSNSDADYIRNQIPEVRVRLSSGISSEQMISIIGSLAKDHLVKLLNIIKRMIGENKKFSRKIQRDKIELLNISDENMNQVYEIAAKAFDKIKRMFKILCQ